MDGEIDFGERVEDPVAVGAFGDDAGHEEMAANGFALRHSQFGEESGERDAGIGFAGFGVCVEDSDGGVGQRSDRSRSEGERLASIGESEGGGANGGSLVMHLLRGKTRTGDAKQEGEWKREREKAVLFHAPILVDFYR